MHGNPIEERERMSRSEVEECGEESKVGELALLNIFLHKCQRIIRLKYNLMLAELVFSK